MNEVRKKKLKFRAGRRGMRELDLYVEAFADARLESMKDSELDEFEAILDLPDQELLDWILGRSEPPEKHRSAMLDQILAFDYVGTTNRDAP